MLCRSLLVVAILFMSNAVQAAIPPLVVEKEFIVEGQEAVLLMDFLGLSTEQGGAYQFSWYENIVECRNDEGSCRSAMHMNEILFTPGTTPKVNLRGFWLDGETGALPDVPKYSILSPPLHFRTIGEWAHVVKRHGGALIDYDASVALFADRTPLVQISAVVVGGRRSFSLGIDDRSPEERRAARQRYERCRESLNGSWLKRLFVGPKMGSC